MENTNFKTMYLKLFNTLTDVARDLEKGKAYEAYKKICSAQRETEEMYIEMDER